MSPRRVRVPLDDRWIPPTLDEDRRHDLPPDLLLELEEEEEDRERASRSLVARVTELAARSENLTGESRRLLVELAAAGWDENRVSWPNRMAKTRLMRQTDLAAMRLDAKIRTLAARLGRALDEDEREAAVDEEQDEAAVDEEDRAAA